MPNKATHVAVGTLAGGCTAAYRAREQETAKVLEIIGGCIGGYIGSCLPDAIEPASWPGHRQFAHSVPTGGGVAYGLYKLLEEWEIYFRSRAEYYKNKSGEEPLHWFQKLLYAILETLSRIAAGGLSGLGAGYLSHLLLDGGTPNGLPLLQ
jgi:membrane-bound metal-dependent hydrolase YbcI (DUF457 family)